MYEYDRYDQRIVEQRSREFRDQVQRRLKGKLSEEEFKPLRLMNGLYLQLHAYMLRVAIPYGVLSSVQLRKLAFIAERYDRGYGHFTTRQNIQFNWPALVDTPDILDELSQVQMHAIQTSGNCIRNITTDPYAGVAVDEMIDPRPLCELLRQWSTLHPEFAYLPRKFKFAVTGSLKDRAAIKLHDIGLQLYKGTAGETRVAIWVGGGQGRTPKIAQLLQKDVRIVDLLPRLEAIMRVYNQHGRRDNKYKARIKILLADTGLEAFRDQVETVFRSMDRTEESDIETELSRISDRFKKPTYARQKTDNHSADAVEDKRFLAWQRHNVKAHRQPGYAIAVITLKPIGGIPGDVDAAQMKRLADLADRYSHEEIRVTHRQNLVLPHVRTSQLYDLWLELQDTGLAEANLDLATDIIACPGLDYCSLATARSIPVAQEISKRIGEGRRPQDIGPVSINISGCINACAHHHVADIGILGLDRAGQENYQLTLGGRNDLNAAIGERLGAGMPAEQLMPAIERVIDVYVELREPDEHFADTYDRVGQAVFQEAVYV